MAGDPPRRLRGGWRGPGRGRLLRDAAAGHRDRPAARRIRRSSAEGPGPHDDARRCRRERGAHRRPAVRRCPAVGRAHRRDGDHRRGLRRASDPLRDAAPARAGPGRSRVGQRMVLVHGRRRHLRRIRPRGRPHPCVRRVGGARPVRAARGGRDPAHLRVAPAGRRDGAAWRRAGGDQGRAGGRRRAAPEPWGAGAAPAHGVHVDPPGVERDPGCHVQRRGPRALRVDRRAPGRSLRRGYRTGRDHPGGVGPPQFAGTCRAVRRPADRAGPGLGGPPRRPCPGRDHADAGGGRDGDDHGVGPHPAPAHDGRGRARPGARRPGGGAPHGADDRCAGRSPGHRTVRAQRCLRPRRDAHPGDRAAGRPLDPVARRGRCRPLPRGVAARSCALPRRAAAVRARTAGPEC